MCSHVECYVYSTAGYTHLYTVLYSQSIKCCALHAKLTNEEIPIKRQSIDLITGENYYENFVLREILIAEDQAENRIERKRYNPSKFLRSRGNIKT
jgi:hypothetical protein